MMGRGPAAANPHPGDSRDADAEVWLTIITAWECHVVSMVERDEHINHLDRLLTGCLAGNGRAVLVEGPAGSGRTELLRAFAERGEERGVRHLAASCSAAESALPFGVVDQLLGGVPWPPEHADRITALLGSLGGDAVSDAPQPPELVRACHDVAQALLAASADTPLLITVDDVRNADRPSREFLLHLVRRLPQAGVHLVMTDETVLRPEHRRFRAELARHRHVDHLRLAPLSDAGALRLLTRELGAEDAHRVGAPILAASGGNPLLLRALIDDHRHSGDAPGREYAMALLGCLHRADPAVLRVARALAVLGDDTDDAEIGRLLGGADGGETAREVLRALEAAGLLAAGRFRHPAARAAVVDDLTAAERAALHGKAAHLRYARGADAPTVARHLIEADRAHDPAPGGITSGAAEQARTPWAVTVLSEAAEHALLDDRHELAAQCLGLAHRAGGDERTRATLRSRLAAAEWQLDPSTAARHLTPLTAAVHAGHLDTAAGLVLVRQLLWHGRNDDAVAVLDRLRTRASTANPGSLGEAAALQDAEVWLAYTHPALARGRRTPALPADLRHTVVAPGTDPQLHAAAALADALARGRAHKTADRAEEVLRDLHLHRRSPWAEEAALLALRVLVPAGRLTEAAAWSEHLVRAAEARDAPTARAVYAAARAEIAARQGDLVTAVDQGRAALGHLSPKGWGVAVGLPLGTLILAATRTGEHEEAAKQLAHAVGDAMFRSQYGLHYLYTRGHHYLATRHSHAALADFLSCGELLRDWGLDAAGVLPWRTAAAEAWLRLDNKDQARRLLLEQLGRPNSDGSGTRGPALRLLAAAGPPGRRLQLLTEAIDLAEASGDRFEQVRVLADLSRAHQANNDKRRARLLLRQALHVANMCDMKPLAQELLSVSAALGGAESMADGLDRIGGLTDSERRVASLAVLGYTNREIAGKLYVTPSTVEQHLTRVYRKLGIRRRKDLPADLWANLRKTG
ncbi:AAA family ATPase [Yinghuangia sp. ASG 101]|uniref:helix-turn-helix transcriptional regulator n=1 Tax=Yinghuangia sp. ASG 101 TaxID=2896848 RepID=UPI001E5BE9AC|nr:helix-turn-helix transcriptional regulator [Yinghuangia sp. ASG 101]UGQ13415.1 AAA family ATPase [Yinghuangia sp. ASG 101]